MKNFTKFLVKISVIGIVLLLAYFSLSKFIVNIGSGKLIGTAIVLVILIVIMFMVSIKDKLPINQKGEKTTIKARFKTYEEKNWVEKEIENFGEYFGIMIKVFGPPILIIVLIFVIAQACIKQNLKDYQMITSQKYAQTR